jgi:hypothetical protein
MVADLRARRDRRDAGDLPPRSPGSAQFYVDDARRSLWIGFAARCACRIFRRSTGARGGDGAADSQALIDQSGACQALMPHVGP